MCFFFFLIIFLFFFCHFQHVKHFIVCTPVGNCQSSTPVGALPFRQHVNFLMNQNEISTYGFETPRKSACRHLWRCCVEHHAFFRLVRVSPIQSYDSELFSLGSRFRYRYVNRNGFAKNSFAKNFLLIVQNI